VNLAPSWAKIVLIWVSLTETTVSIECEVI
jgi:hypothetical protein